MAEGNLGIAGSIAGIFDRGPSLKQVPYDKNLRLLLHKDLFGQSRSNIAARGVDEQSFADRLKASTPLAEELSGERLGFLRSLARSSSDYDPEASFRSVGDYIYGKAGALGPAALDAGKRSASDAAIALGLAPGASSGVVERVRQSAINDLLARTFGTATSALVPSFSAITGARAGERNALLDSLERAAIEPDRLAYRELLPSRVRTEGQAGDIANVMSMIEAYRANTAGFQSIPSFAGRLAEGLGGVENTLVSAYGSLYGGGGGGGPYSSYGGGGGKVGAVPKNWDMGTGGGGWSGGVDMPTSGSPWATGGNMWA